MAENKLSFFVFVRTEICESFEREVKAIVLPSQAHILTKCSFFGKDDCWTRIEMELTGEGEEKFWLAMAISQLAADRLPSRKKK